MNHKFEKRVKRIYAMLSCFVLVAVMTVCPAFAADDPLAVVTNLSDFIFSLIRAIGLILLGFGDRHRREKRPVSGRGSGLVARDDLDTLYQYRDDHRHQPAAGRTGQRQRNQPARNFRQQIPPLHGRVPHHGRPDDE